MKQIKVQSIKYYAPVKMNEPALNTLTEKSLKCIIKRKKQGEEQCVEYDPISIKKTNP